MDFFIPISPIQYEYEYKVFLPVAFALAGCDIALFNACLYLGFYLSKQYWIFLEESIYLGNALVGSLAWLLCAQLFKLYNQSTVNKYALIKKATWKTFRLHSVIFCAYLLINNFKAFHYAFFVLYLIIMVLGILSSRLMGRFLLKTFNQKFDFRKAVAILDLSKGGVKLAAYLKRQRTVNFMGFLSAKKTGTTADLQITASEQLKAASESGVEEVYVSVDPNQINDYSYLVEEGDKQFLRLKFVPDLTAFETNFSVGDMDEFKVLSSRIEPLESIGNRFVKRVFDITVSLLTIIFILSWLYPLLAIFIKRQSPGPVLFKQLRSGRDNKSFNCYKFRSMYLHKKEGEDDGKPITPIGKFMRRTSLDEFPQFINVFFGDMTIIGPRPHMISDTEAYRKLIGKYMVRQFLKPGISGWAQVNGYRGQTMNTEQMEKRVEHDIWYMENWSMLLDVKIMFLTVKNIFKGEENAF